MVQHFLQVDMGEATSWNFQKGQTGKCHEIGPANLTLCNQRQTTVRACRRAGLLAEEGHRQGKAHNGLNALFGQSF